MSQNYGDIILGLHGRKQASLGQMNKGETANKVQSWFQLQSAPSGQLSALRGPGGRSIAGNDLKVMS